MSKLLRVLAYPKDKPEGSIVVLAEGEMLVTSKEGILQEYKKTWEELGKKQVRIPGTPAVEELLKEFINEGNMADIRAKVRERNDEVTKIITADALRDLVMKTPNKACNPLDEIEICTLKKIFGWDMDEVANPHDHSCTILQTLILGLVNSVLSTGFFPEPIMKGVVIPLYKKGDPRDLNKI